MLGEDKFMKVELGVNIDHVGTLRQARGAGFPDPVQAAIMCMELGAQCIVLHLRRDRRHMQESDLERLVAIDRSKIHLEMAATKEMVDIALKHKPGSVCIVPEFPNELTTSGGLKLTDATIPVLAAAIEKLKAAGIKISLFTDPNPHDIRTAKRLGADIVELCTKDYSEAKTEEERRPLLEELAMSSILAKELGLTVHSGHGLTYDNVKDIAMLDGMECLNIGFSIISRAVFVGLPQAVLDMKMIIGE